MALPTQIQHGTNAAGTPTATRVEGTVTTALAYDVDGNLLYVGKAAAGSAKSAAVWQIKKLIWAAGVLTDVQCAAGDNLFAHVWNDRASLSYS